MVESYIYASGNITADRRYDYANALFQEGAFTEAADLHAQVLELVPDWAAGWFAYAEALAQCGEAIRAGAAFKRALSLAPSDPFGAGLHLMRLGQASAEINDDTHNAYIASLFDQYAARFETHLVGALHYRGPQIITAGLVALAPPPRVFSHFIDLGCGTGLMAKALQNRFERASGVDLSPLMIKQAQSCDLYAHLEAGDLLTYLQRQKPDSADLILAADVFVYIGALDAIFAQVRRVLHGDGLFGFSVQLLPGAEPETAESESYALGEDLRFAHSAAYLRRLAAKHNFEIQSLQTISSRQDRGRDVPGLVMFAM